MDTNPDHCCTLKLYCGQTKTQYSNRKEIFIASKPFELEVFYWFANESRSSSSTGKGKKQLSPTLTEFHAPNCQLKLVQSGCFFFFFFGAMIINKTIKIVATSKWKYAWPIILSACVCACSPKAAEDKKKEKKKMQQPVNLNKKRLELLRCKWTETLMHAFESRWLILNT